MQDGTFSSPRHTGVTRPDGAPVDIDTPGRAQQCFGGMNDVLARVGDKWSVYIVVLLGRGPRRFSELKRSIDGVSQRMLTLTLRSLERDGLVTRKVTPIIPPRVDYSLTDLGRSLVPSVMALGDWARANHVAVAAARARYDAERVPADA